MVLGDFKAPDSHRGPRKYALSAIEHIGYGSVISGVASQFSKFRGLRVYMFAGSVLGGEHQSHTDTKYNWQKLSTIWR